MPAKEKRRQFDPIGAYNYAVEVDGIVSARFQSVSGLSTEIKVIEYNDGDDDLGRKMPGQTNYGNITLKRGYIANKDMWTWWKAVRDGTASRKEVSIILYDNTANELMRWNLHGCWPCKWKLSDMSGKADDLTTEELEFVVEDVQEAAGA